MNKDPYEILGVSRTASTEEIKAAYKELVKKYHPDKYRDNPLSDLAEERFKEIQDAYDFLVKNSSSANYRNSNYNSGAYSGSSSSDSGFFSNVRSSINSGKVDYADSLLNEMNTRNGEWYFLKSVIFAQKGAFQQANSYLTEALRREPSNPEYLQFQSQLSSYSQSYSYPYGQSGYRRNDMSNDLCCQMLSCCACLQCCGGCN